MMSCNVGKRQHDIIEGHCSNTLSMQKPHQMCSMFTDAAHFLMHSSHAFLSQEDGAQESQQSENCYSKRCDFELHTALIAHTQQVQHLCLDQLKEALMPFCYAEVSLN